MSIRLNTDGSIEFDSVEDLKEYQGVKPKITPAGAVAAAVTGIVANEVIKAVKSVKKRQYRKLYDWDKIIEEIGETLKQKVLTRKQILKMAKVDEDCRGSVTRLFHKLEKKYPKIHSTGLKGHRKYWLGDYKKESRVGEVEKYDYEGDIFPKVKAEFDKKPNETWSKVWKTVTGKGTSAYQRIRYLAWLEKTHPNTSNGTTKPFPTLSTITPQFNKVVRDMTMRVLGSPRELSIRKAIEGQVLAYTENNGWKEFAAEFMLKSKQICEHFNLLNNNFKLINHNEIKYGSNL